MNGNNEKLKIAPWQEKGHWYHVFVESDGTDYTLTVCDVEDAAISGTYLKMPEGFHVIDYKCDVNVDTAAAATFQKGIRMYADGCQGIVLPAQANFDWCDIQVFGYVAG